MRTLMLLLLASITASPALAITGSGTLTGHSTLTAGRCGRDRARFTVVVSLRDDGTWSVTGPEIAPFGGTYAPKGRSGRKLALTFDDASRAGFVGELTGDVSSLCRLPVTVTDATQKAFVLTLNRKQSRATLTLRYRLAGMANGKRGRASIELIGHG